MSSALDFLLPHLLCSFACCFQSSPKLTHAANVFGTDGHAHRHLSLEAYLPSCTFSVTSSLQYSYYNLIVSYLIAAKPGQVNPVGQFLVWRHSSVEITKVNETDTHHLSELPYLSVTGLGEIPACQSSLQNNCFMAVVVTEALFG